MKTIAKVKMYKTKELGDCFLVRFTHGQHSANILIDCGSFRNGKTSIDRMTEICNDIKKTTDDKIEIVIATHQHNDHLSGFYHCQKVFNSMTIKKVWLSWLENPDNALAGKLGNEYNNFLTNLQEISQKLKSVSNLGYEVRETVDRVDTLLTFAGLREKKKGKKKEKRPPTIPAEAIKFLKTLGKSKPKYLTPGEILDLPGLPKGLVKVYVLGPPQNEEMIKDTKPGREETYDPELHFTNVQSEKMLNALNLLTGKQKLSVEEEFYPFNEPDLETENINEILDYYTDKNKWRQIDNDWLRQAERLALWLDNYTNNTSLVVAFELTQNNKVLLFAADAQTGNWSSWKTIKWKTKMPGMDWKLLLKNTVLYKVGHHCSHNATLVEGLEAMTHNDLVAMIPVDTSDGNIKKKNGWRMPADKLYERLKEKTGHRILRMDEGIIEKNEAKTKKSWKKLTFPENTELFVEFEIHDGID